MARQRQGNIETAITDYDRAIALFDEGPDRAAVCNLLGQAYMELGDVGAALSAYDQAIQHDPCDAGAFALRGNARYACGDIEGAISDYDQAIELDPGLGRAYFGRGIARRKTRETLAAIADFEKVLELEADPGVPNTLAKKARRQLAELSPDQATWGRWSL
jgi:tetratricopeptide (TPR) repeat protein